MLTSYFTCTSAIVSFSNTVMMDSITSQDKFVVIAAVVGRIVTPGNESHKSLKYFEATEESPMKRKKN